MGLELIKVKGRRGNFVKGWCNLIVDLFWSIFF